MKTLVLFDSYFGNTQKVAEAVARTLGGEALSVKEFQPAALNGVELLVVGSPTRGFRPSEGMTAFFKSLPEDALKGVKVAVFDTRVDVKTLNNKFLSFMVKLFGYADKPMAKALTKAGGELCGAPEGFIVEDREGPLRKGELERAAAWAKTLK